MGFTCGDTVVVGVGDAADLCGVRVENYAAWSVDGDWSCTDGPRPAFSVWSAQRP